MTSRTSTLRFALIPLLAGALAACTSERGSQDDGLAEEPVAEPGVEASETPAAVSILRPDVEQPEAVKAALDPLEVTIGFPEGGSELNEAAVAALEAAVASPQIELGGPVILRGHSDAGGSDAVNERASTARAEAVRDWLVESGVDDNRITVIAFGEQNPIEPNALPDGSPNEEGRAVNRRVDISVDPDFRIFSAGDLDFEDAD